MSEPQAISVSRFELLMDAGFGAQKAGDILIRAFANMGTSIFVEPMIPAEISPPPRSKPALSGVVIRVADFSLTNIGNDTDFILASQEVVLDRRLDDQEHNPDCKILLDMGDYKANQENYDRVLARCKEYNLEVIQFNVDENSEKLMKEMAGRGRNMYYMGMLGAIYNVPPTNIVREINNTFGKKLNDEILDKNIQLFYNGYNQARSAAPFSFKINQRDRSGERILIDGNTALALGIIDAGFKLYAGYPITPASSIMHVLAKKFPSYGGMVHQAEDEIAAIGTAVGSYFGGTPAITCTSGPGLSLKQEFIGYASAAEIPLVVVNVQRSGPSTGMPTKTEQSDLPAAIWGCHGDNTKIVLSVGDINDCFYVPHLARYLTEKLRLPVIILSDFQTANSYKVIQKPQAVQLEDVNDIPDFVLERFGLSRLSDDIEMTVTVQEDPGVAGGERRVTGLNTDKDGRINYFAGTNQEAHRIRNEKIHAVRRAVQHAEMFGEEEGDLLIAGWGCTRGALEEAVSNLREQGLKVSGIYFKVIYPLPADIKKVMSNFKGVATVEMAYGDNLKKPPLAMFLRTKSLRGVQILISVATGRPIRPQTIEERAKEHLDMLAAKGKI